MLVRARTDINEYLILRMIEGGNYEQFPLPANSFFFNSGRASLRFFLRLLGKGKRVGVQVFTCSTVLDAIKEEQCVPVFLDINPNYFTSTIEYVSDKIGEMDVLILTHLFGIPNPDYVEIKNLCQDNGVIIIDDLCQTFHAKVNGELLEDLSDNYFYSFFYDKPISMLSGGMLKLDAKYSERAKGMYEALPKESEKDGIKSLKVLFLMHGILSPAIYKGEFRTGSVWKSFLVLWPIKWDVSIAYHFLRSKSCKLINKIIRAPKDNCVARMSDIRVSYVLSMMRSFKDNNSTLIDFINSVGIKHPVYLSDPKIRCSLAKRAIIETEFQSPKAEIALYNWPLLICDESLEDFFPNSKAVLSSHLNIPVWTKNICNVNNEKKGVPEA